MATVNGGSWVSTGLQGDTAAYLNLGIPVTLSVGGTDSTASGQTYLFINVYQFTGPGTYLLSDAGSAAYGEYMVRGSAGSSRQYYSTDQQHQGLLVLTTADTTTHYATGTFYFDATNGGATVQVRSGSFHGLVAMHR